MRLRGLIVVWIFGVTAAVTADAHQFVLGIDQRLSAESNAFKTVSDPTRDVSYEIRPGLHFRQPEGEITYDIQYSPSYEVFFRNGEVDGWDHFFNGTGALLLTPKDSISFRGDVASYRSLRAVGVVGADGVPDVVPTTVGRVTRSLADLEYTHQVSPVTSLAAGVNYERFDYTTPNSIGSVGLGAEGEVTRLLWPRLLVGANFTGTYRSYEELGAVPPNRTTVFNPNVLLQAEVAPTITLFLQGGPSVFFSRQGEARPTTVNFFRGADTTSGPIAAVYDVAPASPTRCAEFSGQPILAGCPLVLAPSLAGRFGELANIDYAAGQRPDTPADEQLNYFVSAFLSKDFVSGKARLSYVRREDSSSGAGSSAILDSIDLRLSWTPEPDWRIEFTGNWSRRQSVTILNFPLVQAGPSIEIAPSGLPFARAIGLIPHFSDSGIDIRQYWAEFLVTRKLAERIQLGARFRYFYQEQGSRTGSDTSSFDSYSGAVSFHFEFDPYTF